jgi:hypothetical protein
METYIKNIKCKNAMGLMRKYHHPYFEYRLNKMITQKLIVIYNAFGLGTKKEVFQGSTIIGEMLLEKMKQDRSILY